MKKQNKPIRILSIDGGGIRGIIPGQILVALENKLRELDPGARIADYFDLVAGTSTGGILSCALLLPDGSSGRPKLTAREVVDLYLKNGAQIFQLSAWRKFMTIWGLGDEKYSAESLENYLAEIFTDTRLSELIRPCVITSYDVERGYGHFFMQHEARNKSGYEFFVRDVTRATSAAPSYFECARILSQTREASALIDGGVFVNNPALCAFAEAQEQFRVNTADMFILSLGTGYQQEMYPYQKVKKWGAIGWIRPLIDIMMSGASQVVDHQLAQIFQSVDHKEYYIRIDPELDGSVDSRMDNASDKNRIALAEFGKSVAEKFDDELSRTAKILTTTHTAERK